MINRKSITILVLFLFNVLFINSSFAQSLNERRIDSLIKKAESFLISNIDSSFTYSLISKKLSEKYKYNKGKANSLLVIGNCYSTFGNKKLALASISDAQKIFYSIKDTLGLAKSFSRLGNINKNFFNYDEALYYFLISSNLASLLKNRFYYASSMYSLGNLYKAINDKNSSESYYKKALESLYGTNNDSLVSLIKINLAKIIFKENCIKSLVELNEAIEICVKNNLTFNLSLAYYEIANIFVYCKKYDIAIHYCKASYLTALKTDLSNNLSTTLTYLAHLYELKKDYNKELKYNIIALQYRNKYNSNAGICSSMNNISNTYLNLKIYDSAYYYAKKSFEISKILRLHFYSSITTNTLYKISLLRKNYKDAAHYAGLSISYKDSSDKTSNLEDLFNRQQINNKNESERIIYEYELLKVKNYKKYWIFFSILLIIILILLSIIYILNKFKNIALKTSNLSLEQKVNERTIKLEKEIINHKKTYNELFKREELFRLVTENTNDIIIKLNIVSENIYITPNYSTLFDLKAKPLIFSDFLSNIHPDSVKYFIERVDEITKDKISILFEFKIKNKNNTYTWVEANAKPIIENNTTIETVLVIRDISERKLKESILNHNIKRHSITNKNANIGLWEMNLETNTIYSDEILYKALGYTSNEIKLDNDNYKNYIHKDYLKSIEQIISNPLDFFKKNTSIEIEIFNFGNIRWIEVKSDILYKEDNTVSIIGTIQDITLRKENQIQLNNYANNLKSLIEIKTKEILQNEIKHKLIFDTVNSIIILFDNKGKILFTNSSAEKILNISIANDIDMFLNNIFEDELSKRIIETTNKFNLKDSEDNFSFQTKINNKSYVLEITLKPCYDTFISEIYFLAVINDITEVWEYNQRIIASENLYRTIVEHNHDLIFIFYKDENSIAFANNNTIKASEFTKKEFYKQNFSQFLGPDVIKKILKQKGEFPTEGNVKNLKVFTKSGKEKNLDIVYNKVLYFEREAILCSARDITDTIKMQIDLSKTRQKLLLIQMDPHFLFNSLMAIQNLIFKNKTEIASSYISEFAKLMRLFLNNSREEFIIIKDEVELLTLYLELQKKRFNNKFNYIIDIGKDIDTNIIGIPPMITQPLAENAIEHGVLNINKLGFIHIKLILKKDIILISVSDNGNGIETIENKSHKSLSHSIIDERLDLFNNMNSTNLILNLKNRTDDKGEVIGAISSVEIPFKKIYKT